MNDSIEQENSNAEGMARIVYFLYLAGIIIGMTGIIGVVIAYVYRDDAPQWLQSHFRFQIRTFWIGALYLLIGVLLSFIIIGYLVLLFWVIWLAVRSVKGLKSLEQKQAHPDPTGWMF
jgi:uncharacterized membrane protein